MKFIYLTGKRYPGNTADHNYIFNLAKAFAGELGNNFKMVVCNTRPDSLNGIPIISVNIPMLMKRTVFFFFWIPWYLIKNTKRRLTDQKDRSIFFSNDQNLLIILIFWRWVLKFPITIISDWHLLSETWKDKYIARYSDRIITTSRKLKKTISIMAPLTQIDSVYGGVSLEDFLNVTDNKRDLRKKLDLPVDKFLVGYIGLFKTLGQEKGLTSMMQSLHFLSSDIVMVFVGGRPDEIVQYQVIAMENGLADRCIFLPVRPFSEVIGYEKAMDILFIPYPDKPHFRNYGFPMKVFEYMASAVPVVYTRLGLLEEILSEYSYGVQPDSPEDFAVAIDNIRKNYMEYKKKAYSGFDKVRDFTWEVKARTIIRISDIMPVMLNIPDSALKYILFQRTEFSIYQLHPFLLRIVMNKKVPIYNWAITVEGTLLSNRTKKLFSADMRKELSVIQEFLPKSPGKILDIGCGVAGIDVMLNKYYETKNHFPDFFLLDKSEVNSKVYYGFEKQAAYYNSLAVAKELLTANGIKGVKIFTQEADGKEIFPGQKFDLIISLISWGFHYPVETYMDYVFENMNHNGTLIIDIRKESGGEKLLEDKFGRIKIIYEARKFRRFLAIKK